MSKNKYFILLASIVWLGMIVGQSQPSAAHGNRQAPIVLQVERGVQGEVWISLTTHQHSSLEIFRQLAQRLGCKLVISQKCQEHLQKERLTVFLKKNRLEQVLEYLTGAEQCHHDFRDGKLMVFVEQRPAKPSEVVAGYKKLLLNASDQQRLALVYFSLGTLFYLKKKPHLALREYNTLLHQYPDSQLLPASLLLMASCSLQTKEYQRTVKILTMFFDRFKTNPFNAYAFTLLARCYEKQSKWENSRRIYEYLLAQHNQSDKIAIKIKLARMLQKQQNYPAAAAIWEELLPEAAQDKHGQIIYAKIQCYLALHQKKAVEQSFRQFYRETPQDPLSAKVRFLHARSLFQAGDYFKSYYLANGLTGEKDQEIAVAAAMITAEALAKIGATTPAIATLQKAIARTNDEEKRIALWRQMAKTCHQAGRWQQSRELWQQLAPTIGDDAYLKILECDYRAENYRQCLQSFQAFQDKIKSKTTLGDAFYLAGKSYQHIGEDGKALDAFQGITRNKGQQR